ncbi:hypothetical protein Gpo141_00005612 [Globisporangium polare]
MVFRRGAVLLCIAAAVALADVGVVTAKDVALHPKAATETQIDYPNGSVMISTKDDAKKTTATTTDKKQKKKKEQKKNAKDAEDSYDSDSSDDKHKKKNEKKVEETVAKSGEIMRKYAHGSVRIFKKDATAPKQKKEHLHKTEVVKEIHATTGHHKHEHAEKEANGDIVKDFDLKEGVNEFNVQGVPLKITVNKGEVDVNVNGKHVSAGEDITVEAPAAEEKKEAHSEKKKEQKKAKAAEKKKEKAAAKKEPEKQKKAAEVAPVKEAEQTKVAVDAKAERVTELATKLSKHDRGFFSTETAPIVFICGIIGALAAVVGIAAVAVARARGDQSEDGNLQSVLADSGDLDIEAAIEDAPADLVDSLEDSESDDDEEMAGEGTFANNEHATVSV